MTALMTGSSTTSSDGKILIAAVTIGAMWLAMVAAGILAYLTPSEFTRNACFWVQMGAGGILIIVLIAYAPLALREMHDRHQMTAAADEARRQVEQLFKMTDMLQSAGSYGDANAVLRATMGKLLPEYGGALYVFNNSRDRLDLSVTWDWQGDEPAVSAISPSHCWALMRGKLHRNEAGRNALRCEHLLGDTPVLEIPMMARGEVYGLLQIQSQGATAEHSLDEAEPAATAIADGMSLALSNISLREKLRTQALRDPLTSLYNRRYMEDALERYSNLAERNERPLSVIMIDLDHFKLLNDEHGHATGDAVLREVAVAIAGAIRPSDVACRYGGEELVVILADCAVDEAAAKAELLRNRVESLSDLHGVRITASFGVAGLPDTSAAGADLLAAADAALYKAKQAGRNRVEVAVRRYGLAAPWPMAAPASVMQAV